MSLKLRSMQLVLASLAVVVVAVPGHVLAGKRGQHTRYIGQHPIAKNHGKGLCYIEGPHVHVYEPSSKLQFRDYDGQQFFVGDPVAYGWDGPRENYMGHHPIQVDVVVGGAVPDQEFCFINGPHFHAFAPAPTLRADFSLTGDAYFFVGTPPPAYIETRPAMVQINAEYTPITYTRPVITVTPPAAWIGIRFAAPVVVVPVGEVRGYDDDDDDHHRHRGRGRVRGDGGVYVDIQAVMPSVEVRLPSVEVRGGVGVFVGGDVKHRGHKRGKGRGKHD